MAVFHDRVFRYRAKMVADRSIEADLSAQDRADVIRLLGMAVNMLSNFGGMEPADVARKCRDDQVSPAVNQRVTKILTSV